MADLATRSPHNPILTAKFIKPNAEAMAGYGQDHGDSLLVTASPGFCVGNAWWQYKGQDLLQDRFLPLIVLPPAMRFP